MPGQHRVPESGRRSAPTAARCCCCRASDRVCVGWSGRWRPADARDAGGSRTGWATDGPGRGEEVNATAAWIPVLGPDRVAGGDGGAAANGRGGSSCPSLRGRAGGGGGEGARGGGELLGPSGRRCCRIVYCGVRRHHLARGKLGGRRKGGISRLAPWHRLNIWIRALGFGLQLCSICVHEC